jgi:hypothetical protein
MLTAGVWEAGLDMCGFLDNACEAKRSVTSALQKADYDDTIIFYTC